MVAHSFKGDVFGPAQKVHGATFIVDVEFRRPKVDSDGIVVDIGRAAAALKTIAAGLNCRNLDEDALFKGHNTTTEFLARVVFDRMVAAIRHGDLGQASAIESLRVTLHESHVASATYDDRITDAFLRWAPPHSS
jgi:6-pyruvoyl-tetrahydropterin synthase